MSDDLISRQAAIALAKDICVPTKDGTIYRHRCIDPGDIAELPSAQPTIIHCADCRWWKHDDDTDPYGYCYACKSGTYTEHWEISIYRKYKGDFYCADAEIKEEDDYE